MNSKKLIYLSIILGMLAFLVNGDNYASAPLLVNIADDFNISINIASFSVTSYMIMFGFLTLFMGALGDRFGKIKIIFFCALGTSIFSIICAFAENIYSLIILRALNGAFASGILPVSVALVGELAPLEKKQNMIGKVMGMMFFGGAVATAIGGALAYFSSWKLVYLVYGIAELILTVVIISYFKQQSLNQPAKGFIKIYSEALSNNNFKRMLLLLFLMGYCILGSFVFTGKLIEIKTGYNVLIIGLILGLFGLGTILAGRKSGTIRAKTGNLFFPISGVLAFCAVFILSWSNSIVLLGLSLFVFGGVFIAFQSSFITISQSILPKIRGTVMALASFCVVVGGSIGTYINGLIIKTVGIQYIFMLTAVILLIVSLLAFRVTNKMKY